MDAELHTDHGGKALAAKRIIYGASKIARFLVGVTNRFLPEDIEVRVMTINGRPGVASFVGDQPESIFTVDIIDGKIAKVYIVRNPDKLGTLAAHLARN